MLYLHLVDLPTGTTLPSLQPINIVHAHGLNVRERGKTSTELSIAEHPRCTTCRLSQKNADSQRQLQSFANKHICTQLNESKLAADREQL